MNTARRLSLFRSQRATFGLLFVLLCTSVYLYLILFIPPRTPLRLGTGNDRLFLYEATRLLQGQVIYRDFFEFNFPGIDLLYAFLIRLLGARAWIPNVSLLCLGIGFLLTSVAVSRRLVVGSAVFLPGLLFVCFSFHNYLDASHHWYSNLLIMAAIAVLAKRRSPERLALAGGLSGLATCFSPNHGSLAAIGFAVFIWWEGGEDHKSISNIALCELCLLVPFGIPFATCVAYYALRTGFLNFVYSTVLFPFTYYRSVNYNSWSSYIVIETVDELLNHHLWIRGLALAILVPGIYVVAITCGVRRLCHPAVKWRLIFLISSAGLALFASIVYSANTSRVSTVSLPAFITLIWLIDSKSWTRTVRRLLWAAVLLTMLRDIRSAQRGWGTYVDTPSGRIAVNLPELVPYYQWLAQNTRPGDVVFDADGSEIYFLFGLKNPTKLPWLTPCEFTRPEQVTDVLRDLEEHQVTLILWSNEIDTRTCPSTGDHLQPVREYLQVHYHKIRTFQGTEWTTFVWKRVAARHQEKGR